MLLGLILYLVCASLTFVILYVRARMLAEGWMEPDIVAITAMSAMWPTVLLIIISECIVQYVKKEK
jgi:hypothetical protein